MSPARISPSRSEFGRQLAEKRDHLLALFDAMCDRLPVVVDTDLTNGAGEVYKEKGWTTAIREIRRPGKNVLAYGHLEPVVVVSVPESPGMSLSLRPDQVKLHEHEWSPWTEHGQSNSHRFCTVEGCKEEQWD